MYVRQLELTNYRNFGKLSIGLPDGPVIFRGDNGQGKSNLLEAVELLAAAKSSRAGSDRELINWSVLQAGSLEPFARVRATAGRGDQNVRAEILVQAEAARDPNGGPSAASKRFRVNGVPRRALEFVGTINAVAFSPEDVGLVTGPPSGRRRYLDVMNSQASRRYLYSLQRYQKVLAQRNHLLRELRAQSGDLGGRTLAVWTEQLAAEGAFLILERMHAVTELADLVARWFCELVGVPQRLQLEYQPSIGPDLAEVMASLPLGGTELADSLFPPGGTEASDSPLPPGGGGLEPALSLSKGRGGTSDAALDAIHRRFVAALERMQPRERAAGVSLVGPHRDDLRFSLDGWDLHVYGSRGQQRLAALALKLGEADLLEGRAGSRPILLLDDVLSELDRKRQEAVLRFISGRGQSLVTVTSLEGVDWAQLPDAPIFEVDQGTARPKSAE